MAKRERDPLRDLDWSKVYADVPGAVDDGVRVALLRIRQRERRRLRALRFAACAACAAVALGAVAAFALRGGRSAPDRVVPLSPDVVQLRASDEVYASRADGRFHVRADCPEAAGEPVALKLVTALEFGKELCPACGANCALEGQ